MDEATPGLMASPGSEGGPSGRPGGTAAAFDSLDIWEDRRRSTRPTGTRHSDDWARCRKTGTPLHDVWLYRTVVVALAAVILAVVVGAIVTGRTMREGVIALAATSVGALGGLLAPHLGRP